LDYFHTESFPDPLAGESSQGGFLRILVDVFQTVLLSLILFLGINAISARIRVDGLSMEPTLFSGEYVLVNRLSYKLGDPTYGDIIIFHFPRNPQQEYIKRIIGLAGDEVQVRDGQVYVNDILVDEPYINAAPAYSGTWTVPEGSLFVLGDNRNNSNDSHDWGWVPMEFVIGKAVFVYWPPTEWGTIEEPINALAAP
jgi:signal peptidase I